MSSQQDRRRMGNDRLDHVLALVRAGGGRVTAPRRAILGALLDSGGHLTADELAARVQRELPDVHVSTVYRTLETLAELGVVDHLHLGHGRAVFHLVEDRHQHLVCERCGNVTELPDEMLADLTTRLREQFGFTLRPDHFAFAGVCRDCREETV